MTPNVAPIFENSRDMIAVKRPLGKSGDPNQQGACRKVHEGGKDYSVSKQDMDREAFAFFRGGSGFLSPGDGGMTG